MKCGTLFDVVKSVALNVVLYDSTLPLSSQSLIESTFSRQLPFLFCHYAAAMVTTLHLNLPLSCTPIICFSFLSELTENVNATVGYLRSIACVDRSEGSAVKTLPSPADNTASNTGYVSVARWSCLCEILRAAFMAASIKKIEDP